MRDLIDIIELKELTIKLIVKATYIEGNIDKFIEILNSEDKENNELSNILFKNENESTKAYLKKMSSISKKMELFNEIITTRKISENKDDLIKVGTEMLKVSQEIIELGRENRNNE